MRTDTTTRLDPTPEVAIRALQPGEIEAAVGVLARGMRDNPLHVAAYGDDPDRRLRCHARVMRAMFRVFDELQPLCATLDEHVVGVLAEAPPLTCQPGLWQRLRFAPDLLALGPGTARAVLAWTSAWGRHDPDERHIHLGPVAVDAHLQGRGIGSQLLREHCRRLDAADHVGYLETDDLKNVRLYARFGYVVVAEAVVLGVPNWFMRRGAQGHAVASTQSSSNHA